MEHCRSRETEVKHIILRIKNSTIWSTNKIFNPLQTSLTLPGHHLISVANGRLIYKRNDGHELHFDASACCNLDILVLLLSIISAVLLLRLYITYNLPIILGSISVI